MSRATSSEHVFDEQDPAVTHFGDHLSRCEDAPYVRTSLNGLKLDLRPKFIRTRPYLNDPSPDNRGNPLRKQRRLVVTPTTLTRDRGRDGCDQPGSIRRLSSDRLGRPLGYELCHFVPALVFKRVREARRGPPKHICGPCERECARPS